MKSKQYSCCLSATIIWGNYKYMNSVFVGLKALKTIKYFIITGTKKVKPNLS